MEALDEEPETDELKAVTYVHPYLSVFHSTRGGFMINNKFELNVYHAIDDIKISNT